ncbi:MAG: DUF374 domain-containing protein [Myxococcota bacterium]
MVPTHRPSGGPLAPTLLWAGYSALARTWRVERHGAHLLDDARAAGAVVLACWHGEQLCLIAPHAQMNLATLVSHSPDGELLARVLSRMGYATIRGSSSRGGARAALRAIRAMKTDAAAVAVAVDGPRGPRHQVQPGALLLARRTGAPLLFAVARAWPAIRLRSWDRFIIPMPFARVTITYGRVEAPLSADALRAKMLASG